VSLSFPSEPADLKNVRSDIQVELGKKGEKWKAHSISVEFIAPSPGLFQFYLSASSMNAGQDGIRSMPRSETNGMSQSTVA
jgi:hypothetical protein